MDVSKVGKAIALLRKRAGFTQKDLADRIGISDKAVSKWERGLGLPDVSILTRLSILLDTDPESLLAGDVFHHEEEWAGLLYLDENPFGIFSGSILFDKPLVYYLLGCFLLVGIRNIVIVCSNDDAKFITELLGDGSKLGIHIRILLPGSRVFFPASIKKTMVFFGKEFIYGVDQTRFFKRAMVGGNQFTIMALPKKGTNYERAFFNDTKRIIDANCNDIVKTQYEYCYLPIFFCKSELVASASTTKDIRRIVDFHLRQRDAFVEVLDRGFIDIPIDDWGSLHEASSIVEIIQRQCGMHIYCVEEIAWRRGMITIDQLSGLASHCKNEDYSRYLSSLCQSSK